MFKQIMPGISKKKFLAKSEPSIGLDIGNYAVKLCQIIKSDNERYRLMRFGYSQIDILNPKGAVEAIKSACHEAKITSRKVNVSVFAEGVIVRYLLLPLMTEDELRGAMSFEIERYVPFSSEEAISDYQVLKVDEEKKHIKVLMVAAKREIVDSRIKLLQEAALEPRVVTIDSMVIRNAFLESYPDKKNITVGILNMGSKVTNINIIRDNYCYFMRDIQIGGENITSLIKEKFGMETSLAEQKKCSLVPKDEEVFKVIEPVMGNLLNEIFLSFDYYESEFGLVVDEVYLSGGTANLRWLVDFLADNLGRPINILEPLKNLVIDSAVNSQKLSGVSSSLVVSVGLALESFN